MMNVCPLASTMLRPLTCSPTAADVGCTYSRTDATTTHTAAPTASNCLFIDDLPPKGVGAPATNTRAYQLVRDAIVSHVRQAPHQGAHCGAHKLLAAKFKDNASFMNSQTAIRHLAR